MAEQWDYVVARITWRSDDKRWTMEANGETSKVANVTTALQVMGSAGWELVNTVPLDWYETHTQAIHISGYDAFFKRRKA